MGCHLKRLKVPDITPFTVCFFSSEIEKVKCQFLLFYHEVLRTRRVTKDTSKTLYGLHSTIQMNERPMLLLSLLLLLLLLLLLMQRFQKRVMNSSTSMLTLQREEKRVNECETFISPFFFISPPTPTKSQPRFWRGVFVKVKEILMLGTWVTCT